ncbi:MAG: peptidoglycan D,D-transpeptidase FtsI family protein, partial [Lachnospiraceae bacterium]
VTDARGVDIEDAGERREEPVAGKNLRTSLDYNIQSYAYQLAKQVMKSKAAEHVSLIVMNPQNGEIMAMVDVPEFQLNDPYTLTEEFLTVREMKQTRLNAIQKAYQTGEEEKKEEQAEEQKTEEEKQTELLNEMWRNGCINDTYEPGSAFKVVTAAAALESGAATIEDHFYCPGYVIAGDRRIRCHKIAGHGSETFLQGTMNSCNPVFVTVGLRIGVDRYYSYLKQFGLLDKTGVDLPGEAGTIMHQKKNIGEVELATMSFGQSFQITPIQLAATVSSLVNGGTRITPHIGVAVEEESSAIESSDVEGSVSGNSVTSGTCETFVWDNTKRILSEETSETLQMMLEQVVENGGGKKAYIEGFHIGGKTATSQTLPRGTGRYIASFVGFSPADDPRVLALIVIHSPQGTYYGGQIAAPVIRQLFENILPYLQK